MSSFSVQCEMDSQRARRSRGGYIIPGALGRQFTGGFFRQGGSVERGGELAVPGQLDLPRLITVWLKVVPGPEELYI